MRVTAPAKINLHLRVGRVRADGFHPLLTWMCTVDLFDTLTLVRAPKNAGNPGDLGADRNDWFTLSTDHPSLPTDGRNLVVKVATAMADTLSQDGEGLTGRTERVSAFLIKRIPAGAGLGGGSSDAAATIRALAAIWKLDWSASRMSEFAAGFGSDVPFFFHGPSSVCTGRGEIVRPASAPSVAKFAVLVMSGIEVPTPKVYAAFDSMKLGTDEITDDAIGAAPDFEMWSKLPAAELLAKLVNDLEVPAFEYQPKLAGLRSALERIWNKTTVRMSGSGSTLFTLCDDDATAQSLVQRAETELKVSDRVVRFVVVRLAPVQHM